MNWTAEQILALAPDAASAKAGQGLATAGKWLKLGAGEHTAWGLCQGSGKDPYQTQIDLTEPAFRCSCPSRKFPCKHALGLFLLLAAQPAAFKEKQPPAWVGEWIASRAKRAQQRVEKQAKAEAGEKIVDVDAQAKRAANREAKVTTGLQELDLWLRDLARGGLAAAQSQPPQFWERTAARLVDAQAPGVARLVREMAGVPASGEGWRRLRRRGSARRKSYCRRCSNSAECEESCAKRFYLCWARAGGGWRRKTRSGITLSADSTKHCGRQAAASSDNRFSPNCEKETPCARGTC